MASLPRYAGCVGYQYPIWAIVMMVAIALNEVVDGDWLIWRRGLVVLHPGRSRSPWLDVLDNFAVELVHRGEHGIDEGPAPLASRGTGIT